MNKAISSEEGAIPENLGKKLGEDKRSFYSKGNILS